AHEQRYTDCPDAAARAVIIARPLRVLERTLGKNCRLGHATEPPRLARRDLERELRVVSHPLQYCDHPIGLGGHLREWHLAGLEGDDRSQQCCDGLDCFFALCSSGLDCLVEQLCTARVIAYLTENVANERQEVEPARLLQVGRTSEERD